MRNWTHLPIVSGTAMAIAAAIVVTITVTIVGGCGDSIVDDYPFPEGKVIFSHPPLEIDGAEAFIGMGQPNVLPKEHGGFFLADPYVFPASVPVLAVADGVIILVSNGTRAVPEIPDAPEAVWGREYDDHLIQLQVSETIVVNYAHVTEWGPATEAEFGDMPKSEDGREVALIVKAGDTLGFVGPHGAMDFSVTDRSLNLNLLNTTLYPEAHRFAADVMAYFTGSVKSRLLAITLREGPPWGGKIDYDVEGRIVGNWFLEGTTSFTQWSRQLAIVYDHIRNHRIVISDGSPMRDVPGIEGPGAPNVWWVKDNFPKPEDVGAGDGIVKYRLISGQDIREPDFEDENRPVLGVMLIEMFEPGKIRVEVFEGTTDAEAFTPAAKVYER